MMRLTGRLRRLLSEDAILRTGLRLAGASITAHLITLAILPLLTRFVTPAEFGVFGTFLSIAGIFMPIVSLRYEWAIPLPKSDSRAARLVQLSLYLLFGSAVFVAAFGWVAMQLSPEGSAFHEAMEYWWALWLAVVVMGLVQILLTGWVVRARHFEYLARARIAQSVFVGALQVALVLAVGGPFALILGFVVGQALAYAPLGAHCGRAITAALETDGRANVMRVATDFKRFPTFSAPSSLLNSAGTEAPLLLFGMVAGVVAAGEFAIAQRLVALPAVLITMSLAQPFWAEAANLVRDDPEKLHRIYREKLKQLALLGLLVAFVVATSPWVFPILLGEEWTGAGRIAALMALLVFGQISFASLSALEYLGMQELNLLWNVGRLFVVVVSILAPAAVGADQLTIVAVYSAASAVWYGTMAVFNEIGFRRVIAARVAS
ncbi:MAG: lipopolysaccharide biosynthesis protein [Gammaproteobacteria bacterium]|nr:lipopolysaccharide biosynthesis protein [Gammaproteobacteria bacterium]